MQARPHVRTVAQSTGLATLVATGGVTRLASLGATGLATLVAFWLATLFASTAHGDASNAIARKVLALEADAQNLEDGLSAPLVDRSGEDEVSRRFIEAEVAYETGNYEDASLLLFDIVEKHKGYRRYRQAVFYLADSLFQKRDYITAREGFRRLVYERGPEDVLYARALERLLEMSLALKDDTDVPDVLTRLGRIPEGQQLPSAPYIRGKYEYFRGNHDTAITSLELIPRSSQYYIRARYFLGGSHVAKAYDASRDNLIAPESLAAAAKIFHELVQESAKTKNDQHILELAHLTLGEIHYAREQPAEAIQEYLAISRRSPLFPTALLEVTHVYVQARQFDKALRALELLEMATGSACDKKDDKIPAALVQPDVCILKGNLSIRKAQAQAQVAESGIESYRNAMAIFLTTRDVFEKPRKHLEKLLAKNLDPKQFFAQVTDENPAVFDVDSDLFQVARRYVREEAEVGRVVHVTTDLVKIRAELTEARLMLDRLDRTVQSESRVQVFPSLARLRERANDLVSSAVGLRQQVVVATSALIAKYADAAERAEHAKLLAARQTVTKELGLIRGDTASSADRIKKARSRYSTLDSHANELEVFVGSLEAEIVAIDKFYRDTKGNERYPQDQFDRDLHDIRELVVALQKELETLRRESAMGADQAGTGDELAAEDRKLEGRLDRTLREEGALTRRLLGRMSSSDRARAEQLLALLDRLDGVDAIVARSNTRIDRVLDSELAEVKALIVEERARVTTYQKELAATEAENLDLGSRVIYSSFQSVSNRFYDITVRADVGMVDVGWARREEAEGSYTKVQSDSAREKRLLRNDFKDVLEEVGQ